MGGPKPLERGLVPSLVLHLVMGEAEIELMPRELRGHLAVGKHAQREGKDPGRVLLDSNYHYQAMRKLPDAERRGRPDIAHMCLVLAQDSIANLEGQLRVWIHTRNDELITVAPETRIMRAQHRFYGLLENLFRDGRAPANPDERALLTMERSVPLRAVVKRTGAKVVLGFHEKGDANSLVPRLKDAKASGAKDVAGVIGAFPHGDFNAKLDFCTALVSIHAQQVSAWTVVGQLLDAYERVQGLHA